MILLRTKKEIESYLSLAKKNEEIGLVPTMGALHEGHLSLVSKALSQNQKVIVSIFVNPTQFNNQEDLLKYPKTLDADIQLLTQISNDLAIFSPSVEEIYADDVKTKSYQFDGLDKVMEGEFREDHFNGVGTIVEMLLRLTKPNRAYFGEKDFQQLQVIRKMVKLKKLPVVIVGCPIVREPNGLAMSSRNERLTKSMRNEASFIYETLQTAKLKFGTKSAPKVIAWVEEKFNKHHSLKLEYIEITDIETLTPIQRKQKNVKYRAFVAVYADDVRLIDNIALN